MKKKTVKRKRDPKTLGTRLISALEGFRDDLRKGTKIIGYTYRDGRRLQVQLFPAAKKRKVRR